MFVTGILLYLVVSVVVVQSEDSISSNRRCVFSDKRCLLTNGGEGHFKRSPLPPLVPLVPTDEDQQNLQRRLPPLVPLAPNDEKRFRHERALPPLVPPRARKQYRALSYFNSPLSSSSSSDKYLSERRRALPPLVPARGHRVARQEFLPPLVPPRLHGDYDMFRRSPEENREDGRSLNEQLEDERFLSEQQEDGRSLSVQQGERAEDEMMWDVMRSMIREPEKKMGSLNQGHNMEEKQVERSVEQRLFDDNETNKEKRFGEMRNRNERGEGKQQTVRHISSAFSSNTVSLEKPEAHNVVITEPDDDY